MKFKKGQHHHPLGSTWSDGWALKGGLNSAKQLIGTELEFLQEVILFAIFTSLAW